MVETRSQAGDKYDAVGSRISALEELAADQNRQMKKYIAKMIEMMRWATTTKAPVNQSSPMMSATLDPQSGCSEPYKEERFEDVCDDPIAEFKQLQETDGILDYHQKFELIKTRVNLSEDYLVNAYLAGLRTDTQIHVRMFHPLSIRQCLLVGRLYETAHPPKQSPTVWSNSEIINNGKTEENMELAMMGDDQTQQHEDSKSAHISVDAVAGKSDYANMRTVGTSFYADLRVISHGDCDMILGSQLFQTLGPITWDFKKSDTRFTSGQREVNFHEIPQGSFCKMQVVKLNTRREEEHLAFQKVDDLYYKIKDHRSHVWHRRKNKIPHENSLMLLQQIKPHGSTKLVWLLLQNGTLIRLSWTYFCCGWFSSCHG